MILTSVSLRTNRRHLFQSPRRFSRVHPLLKSSLFFAASLLLSLVFSANQRAQAQTTIGSCSSANAPVASTGDGAFTEGQVLTVPPGDIPLKSFTLYVASPSAVPISLRFYVYAWKGFVAQGVVVEGLQTQ